MQKNAAKLIEGLQNKEVLKETDDNIVLPDECGDSLWDSVLKQQDNSAAVQDVEGKGAANNLNKK